MHSSLRAACAIPFLFVTFVSLRPSPTIRRSTKSWSPRSCATANLRDLPASATVLDSHTLEIAGVQHFQDVLGLVPNLNWSAGTSRPRFFQLRGIGELSQWQGAPNPSVGFLIDGIDFSGVGMPATLADVERIEVLRGPQGTAYGANALAGLIAVNTRAPQREHELNADVDFRRLRHARRERRARRSGGRRRSRVAARRRQLSQRWFSPQFLPRPRRHQRLRRKQRAPEIPRAAARTTCASTSPRCGRTSTTATTRSRSTTRAPRCPTSPGQDTQISRALAVRLDFDGAESFDVVSRTAFGTSRSVYSFDGDWGNDVSWGANSPYDYFQRFDRERTHAEHGSAPRVARLRGQAAPISRGSRASMRCAPTKTCSSTMSSATVVYGDGERLFASDYRATNLAGYGELEWRLGDVDRARGRARAANGAAPTTRIRTARRFRPTKPCSAAR